MVHVGQLLGTQGREGNAKGVHVHIEVQKGEVTDAAFWVNENTINPLEYLRKWIVTEGGGEDTASGGGNTAKEKGGQFDVNDDGEVNLLDQLLVLRNLGTNNLLYDVNGDKVVDLQDWREIVDYEDNSPASSARAVQAPLEDQTRLLTNYPNPFNPETWIPYQLAWATDVNISIYAADGALVRTLDLGHQPAGLYLQRNRAAYWDGRNAVGEIVASGMYFYTLTVGDFTATRRMIISR